jgi:UMF1 family MFS transporter
MEKGNKKIIRGWISYDWANSVYNLVISSAIFPIFFEKATTNAYINRLYNDGSPGFDSSTISVRTEDVTSFFFWS